MKYRAFYYSGGVSQVPGWINIAVKGEGVRLYVTLKQFIRYEDIIEVTTEYNVADKEVSAGKAVAGGLLFGGIGAVAGAAMGKQKVNCFLKVKYRLNGNEQELIIRTGNTIVTEKIKDKILTNTGKEIKEPKKSLDPLKYHKAFYGAGFKGVKNLADKHRNKRSKSP